MMHRWVEGHKRGEEVLEGRGGGDMRGRRGELQERGGTEGRRGGTATGRNIGTKP